MLPDDLLATHRRAVRAAVRRLLANPAHTPLGGPAPPPYPADLALVAVTWLFPRPHPELEDFLAERGPSARVVLVGLAEDTDAMLAALTAGLWTLVLEDAAAEVDRLALPGGRGRGIYEQAGLIWARRVRQMVAESQAHRLTRRQRAVADLVLQGGSNPEIAAALGIRLKTVKNHLTAVYQALGISHRWELLVGAAGDRAPAKSAPTGARRAAGARAPVKGAPTETGGPGARAEGTAPRMRRVVGW